MELAELLGEVGVEGVGGLLLQTDVDDHMDDLPLLLVLQVQSQQLLKGVRKVL